LTPIALYWPKEGENSFGRASDRAFSLDDAALAADTGAFVLTDGGVRYAAQASKAMTYLGKPLTSLDLVSDGDEKPRELVAGAPPLSHSVAQLRPASDRCNPRNAVTMPTVQGRGS
jgi:hypothetical protein